MARPTKVAPFTGAWIEKWSTSLMNIPKGRVAPFTGAWIENGTGRWGCFRRLVAPFTGAWIEKTK